jgi:hypothetical protein
VAKAPDTFFFLLAMVCQLMPPATRGALQMQRYGRCDRPRNVACAGNQVAATTRALLFL